jgi:hypothetical protein
MSIDASDPERPGLWNSTGSEAMESTPAKPPGKRRRRRIAAAVLVLMSLSVWWVVPGGRDPRFVGYWQASQAEIWRLEGDGTLSMFAQGRYHPAARWAVRSNRLHILPRGSVWLFALGKTASELARGRFVLPWREHEIEGVSPTVISLQGPAGTAPNSQFTLQRIPGTE